ncbi:hypothetical protein Vretimale_5124 [Volvox reticuliferus]|uniref:Uncharacterized protein n=1 Tax=Volvox reticuliferus TaxID=1737510 RepID=A0A8J4DI60_9CHLO|nr:hypothetical protein Vretifemale_4025 [Volvox reticuliferus]GIM00062.1 hypothetical protein Vretimale_5124 [Volvox reticuliferus]
MNPAMMMKTWTAAACCLLLVVLSADGAVINDVAGDGGPPSSPSPPSPTPFKAPARRFLPPAPPHPNAPTTTVIGMLTFVDTHGGDARFALIDANGNVMPFADQRNVMPFAHGYQPPDVEDWSTPISVGDIIAMVSWTAGRLACMHA